MEQYVAFGNTFLHPTLDFLYISWQWQQASVLSAERTKFYPIRGKPLSKFHKVAMTMGRNDKAYGRFGAFVSCLRSLGTPDDVLLALHVPNIPPFSTRMTGFSVSCGHRVVLLDWPKVVEDDYTRQLRSSILRALQEETAANPSFKIPEISISPQYIHSSI